MLVVLAVATLAPVLALPIHSPQSFTPCDAVHSIDIMQFNTQSQHIQFRLPYQNRDDADETLVLGFELPRCTNLTHCNAIVIAGQEVPLNLDVQNDAQANFTSLATINAPNTSGRTREVACGVTASLERQEASSQLDVEVVLQAVDGQRVTPTSVVARWTMEPDRITLVSLYRVLAGEDAVEPPYYCPVPASSIMASAAQEQYIAQELESLRLLEEKAAHLQQQIMARKQVMSVVVAEQRTRRSLQELIDECDGVVCAAKQIATRVYDQINLATADRTQVQLPFAGDVKSMAISEPSEHVANTQALSGLGTSNGWLIKALTAIAGALGLSGLVLFIRRKCMSMRNRVERAADREERRNARAYRRAARRAEMRRRWSNFLSSMNCFGSKERPRMSDYDEKRALILQDALLEQDFSQLEKGDIMEAEIRQLRNAQDIVANIILSRETKPADMRKDPPPSLVPLPGTPARSRASTSTLPSYNSEDLPDYSSIPEPRGDNATTDGFAFYRPSGHSEYIARAPASNQTRSTPVSSIPALSPRVSAETLRTRFSRGGSCGSRS